MQLSSLFTFLFSFVLLFQGIDALAHSKLDRFTSLDCAGKYADGSKHRIKHDVDIKHGYCINIDDSADSIWLGRGIGLFWGRKMGAYSKPGCHSEDLIDRTFEKDGYRLDKK